VALDTLGFYVGTVSGEGNSWAHGFVTANGLFEGSFHMAGFRYHVEPTSHYSHIPLNGKRFNTIIYSEIDVEHDYKLAEPLVVHNLYAAQNSSGASTQQHEQFGQYRHPRSVASKRLCNIYLIADYLFYKNVGREDFLYTYRYIHLLLNEASHIIEQHDFSDLSIGFSTIGFIVEGLMVYEIPSQDPFYDLELSVHELLSKLADQSLDQYCLAHLLTYRDFQKGVVGLAYTAHTGSWNNGGICSKRVKTEDGMKNLNCGLSSGMNYQEALPRMVHSLVIAHELGHNLGSKHDTKACTASGHPRGHFLMFKGATDGSQSNNKKFSHCSREQISEVLNEKGSCLTMYEPECGNNILEDGEQCDCGTPTECMDACCDPHKCQLVEGAECSPAVSVRDVSTCCTANCKFAPSNHTCHEETECALQSTCSGVSVTCVVPVPKPDGKACGGGLKTCQDGVCSGSFCTRHGVSECKCLDESSCDICCQYQNKTCLPVQAWVQLEQLSNVSFGERFLMPGTPCNNYSGYCATDGICDPSGSNAALNDLNTKVQEWFETQFENAPEWLKDNWYWIIVIVLVLIVISILGYGLCCCQRVRSSADDQFVTVDLKTLKATLDEREAADSPKDTEDRLCTGNREKANSHLAENQNCVEAAELSGNKLSPDEEPVVRCRSASVKEQRSFSRHGAQRRQHARSFSDGKLPKALPNALAKTESDGNANSLHIISKSAAKLAEGGNTLETIDIKQGNRQGGSNVNVEPLASGGYYAVTINATPGSWSREREQPVLPGVSKSRRHDLNREEFFPHPQSYHDMWKSRKQQFSDPEENYHTGELSRRQQGYPRGQTSPLQPSRKSNARIVYYPAF
jgi:disintegrin and metalloproteinase domain-containing protein 10